MRHPLKFLFLLLAAIVVLGLVAGAWLVHDGDWIRNKTEEYVSGITGRQFSINGSLVFDLSLHPVVRAEDLRLANPAWAGDTDLVRLQKLRLSIDFLSLFSDQLVFDFIELEGLGLALVENVQGEANWDLFPATEQDIVEDEPMNHLPVNANRLILKDIHVSHQAPGRVQALNFVLLEFEAEKNDDGLTTATAHGLLEDLPLEFRGRVGPLKHFIIGGGVELEVDLSLGEINLNLAGRVADSQTGQGANVTMKFSGPEISWVTQEFGIPEFTQGPFDFDLQVGTGDYDTQLNLVGDLGQLKVNASGKVDDFRRPREGQLKFEITGPNLHSLGQALGEPKLPAAPYHLKGDVSAHLGQVDIHTLLFEVGENTGQVTGKLGEWPKLTGTEIQVDFSGPQLSQWGPVLHLEGITAQTFSYSGHLAMHDSALVLSSNRLESGDGHIELTGLIGRPPEFLDTALEMDLYFPDLSKVMVIPAHGVMPAEPLTVKGEVVRKGQMLLLNNIRVDLAENRASFNGQIALLEGLAGSTIGGRLELPSVATVGRYFSLEDLPELPASINVVLDFAARGLSFKLADTILGDMVFDVEGTLPDLHTPDNISASFQLAVPSLQKIPFSPQAQNLPDLPGRVSGHVEYRDEQVQLANVTGSLGRSKFDFEALVTNQEEFTGSHIEFEISGPDFRPLLAIDALAFLPGEFRASGRVEKGAEADQLKGLELDLGTIQARVSGTVDDLTHPGSVDLAASVYLPSLLELNGLTDQEFPDFPFTMEVSFAGDGSQFTLDPLKLKLGPSDLSGKINVGLLDKLVLEGQLSSDFLDIAWLIASDEGEEAESTSTSHGVFPDTPIPYAKYGRAQIELDLSVARLKLRAMELQGLELDLSLGEDHFQITSFEFGGPLGETVSGKLAISGSEAETLLEFEMEGDELRLGLATVEGQDVSTYPPTSISMKMSGKGATWHQLVSSLDGRIRIIQGQGLIANAGLELLFSDLFSELFNTLNPFAKKSVYTGLECAVINAVIDSGTVLVDPIIIHTEQITILSGGQIDLETEKINLEFQTKVRKGIGISTSMVINPFIKLGGTLVAPTIELDPAGVAFAGTVAVATAGLSLIGKSLFDRFLGNTDPCGQALERLDKAEKN